MTDSATLVLADSAVPGLACDLDALAPAERAGQAATFELLRQQVQAVQELPDGWAVQLPAADDTLHLVARFIANERLCCPFFDFTLQVTPNAGPVWLRLTGQPSVKAMLAGAFANTPAVAYQP